MDYGSDQKRKARKPGALTAVTWLLLTISACSNQNIEESAKPEANTVKAGALLLHPDDLQQLRLESHTPVITLNGTLSAKLQATIRPKVSGIVQSRPVNEGDQVVTGQVLLKLSTSDIKLKLSERQAFLQSQKAAMSQAKVDMTNAQRLNVEGFISPTGLAKAKAAFDAAVAQVEVSRAQLEQTQQQMNDHTLTAPFTGKIGEVKVQQGDKVSPDAPVMNLVNLDVLQLKASASAAQVQLIAPGLSAMVRPEGHGAQFPAKVTGVAPATVGGSRSVPVIIEMVNPEHSVQSGLFAQAMVSLTEPVQALFVPTTALHEQMGQTVVYAILDNQLKWVKVTTGSLQKTVEGRPPEVEIIAGLKEGDLIVASNLGPLEDGRSVQIQKVE